MKMKHVPAISEPISAVGFGCWDKEDSLILNEAINISRFTQFSGRSSWASTSLMSHPSMVWDMPKRFWVRH